MLDCTWIQIIQRLVFVTCLFAVACIAGYFYYLWPANQHAVTSCVPDTRNAIAEVLSVFISAQGNDTVNNPSLGTSSVTESTSNHGVLLNASNPVKGIKYLSYQPPGNGWNNQSCTGECYSNGKVTEPNIIATSNGTSRQRSII